MPTQKMAKSSNPYYPSKFKTGEMDNEWRALYDHMYAQQRKNTDLEGQLAELQKSHGNLKEKVANGPSTTKIGGLNVHAATPKNGQALKYNSATGEIEWTT